MYLEDIVAKGKLAKVVWSYCKDDDLILQLVYELDKAINVPFEIKSY